MVHFGDSWGVQSGLAGPDIPPTGYDKVMADHLGVRNLLNGSQPSSGVQYQAAPNLPSVLWRLPYNLKNIPKVDLVVVNAMVNDLDDFYPQLSQGDYTAAYNRGHYCASEVYRLIKLYAPTCKGIVQVGMRHGFGAAPLYPPAVIACNQGMADAIAATNDNNHVFIDQAASPAYPFAHPSSANDGNVVVGDINSLLISAAVVNHPNDLGHFTYGRFLAQLILDAIG